MTTPDTVTVHFRVFEDRDACPDYPIRNVIAIFPDEPWDRRGSVAAYMHIGQHRGASPALLDELRPATPDEYAPLLAELERYYAWIAWIARTDPPSTFTIAA